LCFGRFFPVSLIYTQSIGSLDGGSASRKVSTKNKAAHTDIRASSEIRTHDLRAWAGEDSSCLRHLGHSDLQWSKITAWNHRPATCFEADITLGIFDPEDGGDMFLRNVDWLSTDYKALCPTTQYYLKGIHMYDYLQWNCNMLGRCFLLSVQHWLSVQDTTHLGSQPYGRKVLFVFRDIACCTWSPVGFLTLTCHLRHYVAMTRPEACFSDSSLALASRLLAFWALSIVRNSK
jgi:hypothetical protein